MKLHRSWQMWVGCLGGFLGTLALAVGIEAVTPSRPNLSRRNYTLGMARAIREALDQFQRDHQRFPSAEEGLNVLVPQYLLHLPPDAWGNSFVYVPPSDNDPPDVVSYGADGQQGGTNDDVDLSAKFGALGSSVTSLAYLADLVIPAALVFSVVALLFSRGRSQWACGMVVGVLLLAVLLFVSQLVMAR